MSKSKRKIFQVVEKVLKEYSKAYSFEDRFKRTKFFSSCLTVFILTHKNDSAVYTEILKDYSFSKTKIKNSKYECISFEFNTDFEEHLKDESGQIAYRLLNLLT